jgi:hypothetical protein
VNKDTIYVDNISLTDDFLEYSIPNDRKDYEISIKTIAGYYSALDNTYYEKKLFSAKTRGGFLNLSYKKKDFFDFVELIFEGKVKTYRSANYYIETDKRNFWYIEKEDSLQVVFSADFDKGYMKFENARYNNLNHEFFKFIFSDDEKALTIVNTLKKGGKLEEIRALVNDYNNRYHDKTNNGRALSTSPKAGVTFLRDSRKELKDDLKLMVDNRSYHFPKNSKLKLEIPSDRLTKICIENSENKYCRLVSSSPSYPKFYKLILDKDDQGDIFKVNGLSSYYEVRLENYENVEFH